MTYFLGDISHSIRALLFKLRVISQLDLSGEEIYYILLAQDKVWDMPGYKYNFRCYYNNIFKVGDTCIIVPLFDTYPFTLLKQKRNNHYSFYIQLNSIKIVRPKDGIHPWSEFDGECSNAA